MATETDPASRPFGTPYSRFAPSTLRAAWWALRAVRKARRDLVQDGVRTVVSPPPRGLPWASRTGVNGVLNRTNPTCLERALVLQTWLARHGRPYDIVIGVATDPDGTLRAHAWVDGETVGTEPAEYDEIHRIGPR